MTNNSTQVITGKARISYEHLLKPYSNQPGSEEKYSVTLIIPKADIATKQKIDAAIYAAIQAGISGKWGGVKPAQPAVPVYDGDGIRPNGEAFSAECKGCWVFTASSKQRPELVDINLNPILDATEIYSGMYARVSINFFAYFSSGKKGIGCGLGNVQKLADGEPLGSKTTAASDFGGDLPMQPNTYAAAPAPSYRAPQPQQQPQYASPQYNPRPQQAPQYAPQQPQQPQRQVATDPITGAPIYGI